MDEDLQKRIADNLKLWGIRAPEEEMKAQLTYGNWIINITVKPNLLMRLFMKLLGIKVKIFEGDK